MIKKVLIKNKINIYHQINKLIMINHNLIYLLMEY